MFSIQRIDDTQVAKLAEISIDPEWMQQWPLYSFDGPIHIIHSVEDAAKAVEHLYAQNTPLGIDTESRPAFRKGERHLPSLVQIAAQDVVYLFQIQKMGTLGDLVTLFEDDAVTKAGIALHDDIGDLRKFSNFNAQGFVDVGRIASSRGLRYTGLRNLGALCFGKRISKGAQVSNWAADTLSEAQVRYAATDAWMSRAVYLALA